MTMSDTLQRMQDAVNLVLPAFSAVTLIPVGSPRFLDPLLKGRLRFAQAYGTDVAAWSSACWLRLKQATKGNAHIVVESVPPWLRVGDRISVADRFIGTIRQIETIDAEVKITFWTRLAVDLLDQDAFIYSVRCEQTATLSPDQIIIASDNFVLAGDELETVSDWRVVSVMVTEATHLHSDAWLVKLDKTVATPTGSAWQLRTHPAYQSDLIPLSPSLVDVGPALLDWHVASLTDSSLVLDEVISARILDSSEDLLDTVTSKNELVENAPVSARSLAMSRTEENTVLTLTSEGSVRIAAREYSRFKVEFHTAVTQGTAWHVSFQAVANMTLQWRFEGMLWQDVALSAGVKKHLKLEASVTGATYIEFGFLITYEARHEYARNFTRVYDPYRFEDSHAVEGQLSADILQYPYCEMSSMIPDRRASYVQYTHLLKANGPRVMVTGAIWKPVLPDANLITGPKLDSGNILL